MINCTILLGILILMIPMYAPAAANPEKELLEMDKTISAVAEKQGILNAMYPYLTERSALFPDNGHPVMGKKTCGHYS